MHWLENVVNEILARQPEGEILVSSGASPSGVYHVGHLREVILCDAIVLAIRERGREARHIHVVDNLDAFRKVPVTLPDAYKKYLGMPLCNIPAPDGSRRSYADFCVDPFLESMKKLGIEAEIIYQDQKYQSGFYAPAIERSLKKLTEARNAITEVSGCQLDERWSPIQILEDGRLKNYKFISIDTEERRIAYEDSAGEMRKIRYDNGSIKLDWRLDWPGRWWLMGVAIEPFGRDHATKGGSYDTGVEIAKRVYGINPPIPVPYEFINRTGDTKKMSASKGTGINAEDVTNILPSEITRYFMLRSPASKRLFFDETDGLLRLVDEYSALLAKSNKTPLERQILHFSRPDNVCPTISRVPFTYLVDVFQAALRNADETMNLLSCGEYADIAAKDSVLIKRELAFVNLWLDKWAPERVVFSLQQIVGKGSFSDSEIAYLKSLADSIAQAPPDADGVWFHNCIYSFKDNAGLSVRQLFSAIYRITIGKESGQIGRAHV